MISLEDTFFFDQTALRKPQRRCRKSVEELPQNLRFAQLNPKLAGFYKDSKPDDENLPEVTTSQDEVSGIKESILPEISSTFSQIKNQILSGFLPDYDRTRQAIQQYKSGAPSLLEELGKLLPLVSSFKKKLSLPRSVEQNLLGTYDEIIYDAKYVKREWQLLENQLKHEAELLEKLNQEKEAHMAAENSKKKIKMETFSESDDDASKHENSNDGSRPRTKQKKKRPSQPATIIEETLKTKSQKSGTPARKSRYGSASLKSTPGYKLDLGRQSGAGDNISEASHSLKSAFPQPYSMQVLAFNLTNYQVMENKGCHVFGINSEQSNEHPLEWVVRVLNQSSARIKESKEEAVRNNCTEIPYIRYYNEEFSEKALAKTFTEKLGIYNRVMKGRKPKIPSLKTKLLKSGEKLCTQVTDGSRIIYYETGEVAIVTCFQGEKGFYTIALDKDEQKKMLASFSPAGTGCCYTVNNRCCLLVTEDGGHVAIDDDNAAQWVWPGSPNEKLLTPINMQINEYMTVKVVSRSHITLTFQSGNNVIKLPIGYTEGVAASYEPQTYQLKMGDRIPYSSQTAKDLIQTAKLYSDRQSSVSNYRKAKLRDVKTPKKGGDDATSISIEFSDNLPNQDSSKLDKDFTRLKTKAKNLIDDWLDVYRIALGITSPQIKLMKTSSNLSRLMSSAKSLPAHAQNDNADELATTPIPKLEEIDQPVRMGSAPSVKKAPAFRSWINADEDISVDKFSVRLSAREKNSTNTLLSSKISLTKMEKDSAPSLKHDSTLLSFSLDNPTVNDIRPEWTLAKHYQCPVALRDNILCKGYAGRSICRCQRRRVPDITDVELEIFINKIVPSKQLIVIALYSSLYPGVDKGGEMMDKLFAERNINRTHVCMQARADPYRVFRYDIATAFFDTGNSQPLLFIRHNAVAGMYLIFQAGKLIFCDHIFNGYGNAKRDFQKQLIHCRHLCRSGFSLPADFKFTPQKGRHGPRSPWGGEIGGAGVNSHGAPGTSAIPFLSHKTDLDSPDSASLIEAQIGKNVTFPMDIQSTKSLVSKISKQLQPMMVPT